MSRFSRNLGFITAAEQHRLADATVCVAGAGGDGGQLAIALARLGIGTLRLADPETFEVENINRQAGSAQSTVGWNKAEVVSELIRDINPDASVVVLPEGITADNVDAFVAGADVVVDEMEYTRHWLAVSVARAARRHGVPDVMGLNIGFGCCVTSFVPGGRTVERHLGLDETADIEEIAAAHVSLRRWIPRLPRYADLAVLGLVEGRRISAPSVVVGVDLAAGATATEVLNHLIRRRAPVTAPRYLWFDAMEGRGRVIRRPALSFFGSLAAAGLRSRLGLNQRMNMDLQCK